MDKGSLETKGVFTEFCRKLLTTYNHYQISANKRLYELPEHEKYLKQMQDRWQEDEMGTQLIKCLDERVLKNVIALETVSNRILEDQLQLIPSRMANIKSQVAKHEVTIIFLEPLEFETIVTNANTWKQFINEVDGPT